METLQVNLGVKRISINGDPEKIIEINPQDALFAEKAYKVYGEVLQKQQEWLTKAEAMSASPDQGNPQEQISLMVETCKYMRDAIDYLIGPGTSQKVFGDFHSLDAIAQFLEGLVKFIQPAREEKIKKYTNPGSTKAME